MTKILSLLSSTYAAFILVLTIGAYLAYKIESPV